jgi:hypothetical protein
MARNLGARDGQIPEPPQVVVDANAEFDVEYMGALVRAQRNDRAVAIERVVTTAAGLGEAMPELLDSIDPNKVMGHLVRDLNAPMDILRDETEVKEKQDERAAMETQAQNAALLEQQGNAGQAVAGAQQMRNDDAANPTQ